LKRVRGIGRRLAVSLFTGLLLAILIAGCDPFGFTDIGDRTLEERLGHDLADGLGPVGRVECRPMARNLWSCRVEGDPGSGFSGTLNLKLDKNGCWQARHVGSPSGYHRTDPTSDLSVGDQQVFGRTIRGCTSLDD
jgi:hypothetical protein